MWLLKKNNVSLPLQRIGKEDRFLLKTPPNKKNFAQQRSQNQRIKKYFQKRPTKPLRE
jgi:hypothetical protein